MDRKTVVPSVKRLPGPKTKKWMQFHHKYASKSTYVDNFVWARDKPATGPFCQDPDGNVILDFVSHVGASVLGYNNPELLSLQAQLSGADPDKYAGADFLGAWGDDPATSKLPTPAHLHHKIIKWTKQFKFDTAFFCNTGAEAVENAIKICYDHRRNNGFGITMDGAFHGRTLGALSLNRSRSVQRKWYPMIPKTVSIPYGTDKGETKTSYKVIARNGEEMSALKAKLHPDFGIIDPDAVAYVIAEPMQGEGGYNVPKKEFLKELQEICRRHDIPLIMDEIQAGLGRSGKKWACEHFGIKPDMITSSKGLRVGATIGKSSMFPKESGRISGTWCEGNAIASALGYKAMDIIEKKKLVDNAEKMGKYLRKRANELPSRIFSNVRGLGLMDAVEVKDSKLADRILDQCLKEGVLLLGCGLKSIRFLPPLDVTKREIDMCMEGLETAARKVARR